MEDWMNVSVINSIKNYSREYKHELLLPTVRTLEISTRKVLGMQKIYHLCLDIRYNKSFINKDPH